MGLFLRELRSDVSVDAGEVRSTGSHEDLSPSFGQHDHAAATVAPACTTFDDALVHQAVDEAGGAASGEPAMLGDRGRPEPVVARGVEHEQDLVVLDADVGVFEQVIGEFVPNRRERNE